MTKMKKNAAFALIIMSVLLLVGYPQYGLAATSLSNTSQEPQITLSTAPSFSLTASPARLYIVVGETESSKITVSKFSGTVDLQVVDVNGIIAQIEPKSMTLNNQAGNAVLSVKAQPKIDPGKYVVTVKASSGLIEKTVSLTVQVLHPDFKLSASPSTIYVESGKAGTATITLYSVDRFNGTIALAASTPTGWTSPILGKNEPTLTYPAKSSTTLSVTPPANTKPGKYVITVSGEYRNHGESDDISHAVNVTVQVISPDFRVYANPSTMYLLEGTSQNSIIRVNPIDRFNGSVSLTLAEIVHPDSGSLTEALSSPTTLSILYNQANSSTLSITVPPNPKFGKYIIQVIATGSYLGNMIEHRVNVTVHVINPEFAIYTSASLMSIPAGKSANVTLRAMSIGRLNDTITLEAAYPSGWTAKIYNSQLKVAYNQSSSTIVTIAVPAGAESGLYLVDFKGLGASSTLTDTTTIKIVVP